MVSDMEFIVVVGFMLFLAILSWIMSMYWAEKYKKLERQIDEILEENK